MYEFESTSSGCRGQVFVQVSVRICCFVVVFCCCCCCCCFQGFHGQGNRPEKARWCANRLPLVDDKENEKEKIVALWMSNNKEKAKKMKTCLDHIKEGTDAVDPWYSFSHSHLPSSPFVCCLLSVVCHHYFLLLPTLGNPGHPFVLFNLLDYFFVPSSSSLFLSLFLTCQPLYILTPPSHAHTSHSPLHSHPSSSLSIPISHLLLHSYLGTPRPLHS